MKKVLWLTVVAIGDLDDAFEDENSPTECHQNVSKFIDHQIHFFIYNL